MDISWSTGPSINFVCTQQNLRWRLSGSYMLQSFQNKNVYNQNNRHLKMVELIFFSCCTPYSLGLVPMGFGLYPGGMNFIICQRHQGYLSHVLSFSAECTQVETKICFLLQQFYSFFLSIICFPLGDEVNNFNFTIFVSISLSMLHTIR